MVASSVVVPKSGLYAEPREDWLALYSEAIIDPTRRIIDAHHHLWDRQGARYMLEELTDDIAMGHNIVATVYVDCRSMYRASGPEAFKPVGEVEFANGVAAQAASGGYGACQINAAVSLRLKSVESTADMMIISPPSSRAATAVLREIYTSFIR